MSDDVGDVEAPKPKHVGLMLMLAVLAVMFLLVWLAVEHKASLSEDGQIVHFFQKYSEAILTGDDELASKMRSEGYHQIVKQPDGTVAEVRKSRSEMLDVIRAMRSRWKPTKYDILIISAKEQANGTFVVETRDRCIFTLDGKQQQVDTATVRTLKRENGVLTLWQERYSVPEDAESDDMQD